MGWRGLILQRRRAEILMDGRGSYRFPPSTGLVLCSEHGTAGTCHTRIGGATARVRSGWSVAVIFVMPWGMVWLMGRTYPWELEATGEIQLVGRRKAVHIDCARPLVPVV